MKNFYESIVPLWEERRWGYLIIFCLLSIGCIAVTIILSVWLLEAFASFFAAKFDTIMTALTICFIAFYYFQCKKEERQEKRQAQTEQKIAAEEEAKIQAIEAEKTIAENTYILLRQCLFSVLIEKASAIGLEKPCSLSELDSPARLIVRNDFILCEYIALKQGSTVDTNLISEYLITRVTQRLNAGEFPELPTRTYIYEGRAFPAVYIDSVTDAGAYVQIRAILVNENYCRYLQNRQFARLENRSDSRPPKDSDF